VVRPGRTVTFVTHYRRYIGDFVQHCHILDHEDQGMMEQVRIDPRPRTRPRRLVVFAGDHGVVESGVTAWPQSVTGAMMGAVAAGRAACSALAGACGAEVVLVDVGSRADAPGPDPGWLDRRVARGTANLARGPAMSAESFDRAWAVGVEQAPQARDDGMLVVAAGELGIGNTTPASCLARLLADVPPESAVGRGAGADDATLARKRAVVEQATARARRQLDSDPRAAIAEVCGFEITAIAGFHAEAHRLGLTAVLDGAIATAAAACAPSWPAPRSGSPSSALWSEG
jgi:nicotinate-nucleotide--dimethylbenzimidazole phosphoribosyltransferase